MGIYREAEIYSTQNQREVGEGEIVEKFEMGRSDFWRLSRNLRCVAEIFLPLCRVHRARDNGIGSLESRGYLDTPNLLSPPSVPRGSQLFLGSTAGIL